LWHGKDANRHVLFFLNRSTIDRAFEYFILVTIFANCVALAIYTPYPMNDSCGTNIILVCGTFEIIFGRYIFFGFYRLELCEFDDARARLWRRSLEHSQTADLEFHSVCCNNSTERRILSVF
jgi:hypothetical protein